MVSILSMGMLLPEVFNISFSFFGPIQGMIALNKPYHVSSYHYGSDVRFGFGFIFISVFAFIISAKSELDKGWKDRLAVLWGMSWTWCVRRTNFIDISFGEYILYWMELLIITVRESSLWCACSGYNIEYMLCLLSRVNSKQRSQLKFHKTQ